MSSPTQTGPVSSKRLLAGRIVSAFVALFMVFDSVTKVIKVPPVMEAFGRLGFPESTAPGIGILLLVCLVVYLIPRSAVLGAILLTGYLGGATAANVRVGDPVFETIFPVLFGILVWAGILLREGRLGDVVPLRR